MLSNKKVLHVVNVSFVLPYFIGDQFHYFAKKGVKFSVACRPSEHFSAYALEKNFHPLGIHIEREMDVAKDLKSIATLYKFIRKKKIEIVIAHTPKGGLLGMIAATLAGVKTRVYFRHGIMYETSIGMKRAILKKIEQLTGALATQVVCVSPSVLHYSALNKLSSAKKNIILNNGTCNGVDLNRFSRTKPSSKFNDAKLEGQFKDAFVIGYVGRLVRDKGIGELIEAWKILLLQHDNIKLLLVGPFEERDALNEADKNYIQAEPSIIFTDFVMDAVPYYKLMDVFILPSYREGFPTVILEASAMELPVITTRSTGCVDAIKENETGIYTDIEGHDIASNINFYVLNPDIAKLHGANGREFVKNNFDQEFIWKEIEKKIFKNK